jgi:hypothetical protein
MSFIQVVSIKAKHIQLTWLLESWYNFNLNTPIDSTLKNQSKVFGNPPIRSNIFVLNFNKHIWIVLSFVIESFREIS